MTRFSNGEEQIILKDDVVEGFFSIDGMEIAKISNDYLGDDSLAFGRIAFENYSYVLLPLTDDEYEKALKRYQQLMDAFV